MAIVVGRFAIALGIALAATLPPPAAAQTYPAKPVRIICAFPVGGIADIYARVIGARLGEPIVVEIAKWAPVVKASGARAD